MGIKSSGIIATTPEEATFHAAAGIIEVLSLLKSIITDNTALDSLAEKAKQSLAITEAEKIQRETALSVLTDAAMAQKELDKKNQESLQKERDIDGKREKLEEDALARNKEIEDSKTKALALVSERIKDADNKELALMEREALANKMKNDAETLSASAQNRHSNLDALERELEKKERDYTAREISVTKKEEALAKREKTINARKAKIKNLQAELEGDD